MTWAKFWLVSLFAKLVVAAVLPLSADECYYWVWSRNLQASYFDHPPMVAYWFAVAEWLGFGGYSVRFIGVVLGHLGLWFWVRLFDVDRANPENMSLWWLLLAHPLTGLGSIIMTPDAPLMFFAALSAWWVKKVGQGLLAQNSFKTSGCRVALFYFGLGFLLGLGFMSKYHIVIWAGGLAIWLLGMGRSEIWRQLLGQGGLLWGLLGFVLGSAPVWWWNGQHDWVSFRFQLKHGLGSGNTPWWETVGLYVAGQVLLMHPLTWWYVVKSLKVQDLWSAWTKSLKKYGVKALWRCILELDKHRPSKSDEVFFVSTAFKLSSVRFYFIGGQLISFLFFLVSSFRKHVEANWTTLAFPAWLYVSSRLMPPAVARGLILFWFGIIALVASHWVKPWATFLPEKFSEVREERPFIDEIKKTDCPVIFTTNYQKASLLYFYTQISTYKLSGVGRRDQFDLWAFDKNWHEGFCTLFQAEEVEELRRRWPKLTPIKKLSLKDLRGRTWELLQWQGG